MAAEGILVNPTDAVAKDDVDDVDVETGEAEPTIPPPLSLFIL